VAEPAVLSWACSQYVGQLIYANVYGVTSAAYVLLTTLGKTSHQHWLHLDRVADPDPDSIGLVDPDPDPGGQK
jgi:hypothetical protein